MQLITLIGEAHSQRPEALQLGQNLLKFYETVGKERGYPLASGDQLWRDAVPFQHHITGFEYSLTTNDGKHSKILNLEYGSEARKKADSTDRKKILCGVGSICTGLAIGLGAYLSGPEWDDTFSNAFKAWLVVGGAHLAVQTFGFWPGEDLGTPGNIRNRDEAMVRNLLRVFEPSENDLKINSVAGVIGHGHLFGVRRGLLKAGFVDRNRELNSIYSRYLKDQSESLIGTHMRTLKDPFDSFLGPPGTMVSIYEQIYPEAFSRELLPQSSLTPAKGEYLVRHLDQIPD